ncbi:MAG: hypothetical protein R3211_03295 [Balneolaceae bacterium]|nr:hypothetical protein [Balneolaceae bacterium]
MNLIEEADTSGIGQIEIHEGSGSFLVEGGPGYEGKLVTVYYHKPDTFTPDSPVLLVIPGSGRNGWDYRDAWVEASEQHGILVLSPAYDEEQYVFEDYHMGGVIENSNLLEQVTFLENSNVVRLQEKGLEIEVNPNRREWIYGDFDRIFELAAKTAGSEREQYDIFGHSAGGQILHRMVLFHPRIKANRILASNSGFYTLPDFEIPLPFGLKDTPADRQSLEHSFSREMVLFIGELDNANETGGLLLRSPTVDEQGTHRLARARHFYRTAQEKADALDAEFNWELEIVPNVGHDHEKMSRAAAAYLYEEK